MNALLMALLLTAPAQAQDDADGDEFDFLKPDDAVEEDKVDAEDFDLYGEEDEFEIASPIRGLSASPSAAPAALEAVGDLLGDGYPVAVLPSGAGAAVLELPVLLSRGGGDVSAEGYWLGITAWAQETKVGESWEWVAPQTVPAGGPGFAYLKLQVPSPGPVELRVTRADAPAQEGEELFRKTVNPGQ